MLSIALRRHSTQTAAFTMQKESSQDPEWLPRAGSRPETLRLLWLAQGEPWSHFREGRHGFCTRQCPLEALAILRGQYLSAHPDIVHCHRPSGTNHSSLFSQSTDGRRTPSASTTGSWCCSQSATATMSSHGLQVCAWEEKWNSLLLSLLRNHLTLISPSQAPSTNTDSHSN